MKRAATGRDSALDRSDCIFCKIIAGEIPSRRIYDDEHAVAFLDIAAWHRGHTLVVPKRHVADLVTGDPAMAEIGTGGRRRGAAAGATGCAADGLNFLSSAGAVAGQEVFHLHVHLVPRYADAPGLP